MQVVGFNLTKVSAHKIPGVAIEKTDMDVAFSSIEKEKNDFLKDKEVLKAVFKLSLEYKDKPGIKQAEVVFEGNIIFTVEEEESKEIFKLWKKREISPPIRAILFNNVMRRCSSLAIFLQDQVNLPSPFLKIPVAQPNNA